MLNSGVCLFIDPACKYYQRHTGEYPKGTSAGIQWRALRAHLTGFRPSPRTPIRGLNDEVHTISWPNRQKSQAVLGTVYRLQRLEIAWFSQERTPKEYVFSSLTAKSGRLEEPRNPHNKALAAAALPALSLHGLRRSFGTLSEWVEVPAGIVAQIILETAVGLLPRVRLIGCLRRSHDAAGRGPQGGARAESSLPL